MAGLLDTLEAKGLKLRNRIVMPPMQTGLATKEGAVTDALIEYYSRRAKAIGLLIVEHGYVSLEGKLSERQLRIYNDSLVGGLEMLSSSVHAMGTPVVVQINHAGKNASEEITGMQPVAPSPVGDARKLKAEEIEGVCEAYAGAAVRAMKAGFDGVEIHGAHGFLLNQFYSPLTNRRNDKYGGSLQKRMRFPLEVVESVREKIGGRLLLYRLGSDDLDPAGTQIEDSKKFAVELEEAGADIIDVSGGLCGGSPENLKGIQGYFIPQAQKIKEVVGIPVVGVGGIKDPEYADRLIREGSVDLVAVGRGLLNDPDWAEKAVRRLGSG